MLVFEILTKEGYFQIREVFTSGRFGSRGTQESNRGLRLSLNEKLVPTIPPL